MLLWFWTLFLPVHAATVLIQGEGSSGSDYRAMLYAHPEYQSPSQFYRAQHPTAANRNELMQKLASAQSAYLQQSVEEAKAKFLSVLDLLERDDWSKAERETFLYTYLRLAQLSTEVTETKRWLSFSWLLGEGLHIDSSLFPPPLLTEREAIGRQLVWRALSRPVESGDILVNGVRCSASDCGRWPVVKESVRVTFLSDEFAPYHANMEIGDWPSLKPRLKPLARGGCARAEFHSQATMIADKKVFWNLDCEPPPQLNLKPRVSATPWTEPSPEREKAFYHSKWFWIGTGTAIAVAAAFMLEKKPDKNDSGQTTTTYGFR